MTAVREDKLPPKIEDKPPLRKAFEALRVHLNPDEWGANQGGPCENPEHIDGILRQYGYRVVPLDQEGTR